VTSPADPALDFMRRFRAGLDAGAAIPEALARGAVALPRDWRELLRRAARRAEGDYTEDEWGFDEEFAEMLQPFLELLYDRWWRVEATGIDNVPGHGRALLAANHAGILPFDATMMAVALARSSRTSSWRCSPRA
jgi:hypothetical protein